MSELLYLIVSTLTYIQSYATGLLPKYLGVIRQIFDRQSSAARMEAMAELLQLSDLMGQGNRLDSPGGGSDEEDERKAQPLYFQISNPTRSACEFAGLYLFSWPVCLGLS